MSILVNNGNKGVCLIAMGIVMRDTNCSSEEVQTLHKERYIKLIAKKGKNFDMDPEDAEVFAGLTIGELTS